MVSRVLSIKLGTHFLPYSDSDMKATIFQCAVLTSYLSLVLFVQCQVQQPFEADHEMDKDLKNEETPCVQFCALNKTPQYHMVVYRSNLPS